MAGESATRVSESILLKKNPNLNFILGRAGGGGGGGCWLGLVIFFTKNPNLKYNIFGGGGNGGRGSVAKVIEFCLQRIQI